MANQTASSPFFARSYGGFSLSQIKFIHSAIAHRQGGFFLDPMAGQARDFGDLALKGWNVIIEDINPACLCLAALRSPQLISRADRLVNSYLKKLATIKTPAISETDFVNDEWLTPSTISFIKEYKKEFEIREGSTPFQPGSIFWDGDIEPIFATALLVLAARKFVCYRPSKNTTWIKEGGIIPLGDLRKLLGEFAASWAEHVQTSLAQLLHTPSGSFKISTAPADGTLAVSNTTPISGVITSPPYANRLDYSVMWGPELAVLCELFDEDQQKIKRAQIGTTVVRGLKNKDASEQFLPPSAMHFLNEVASGKGKASDSYYLPFFRNYLVSLTEKLTSAANLVEQGGIFVCFIRDCVRKDARLDAEIFVSEALKFVGFEQSDALKSDKVIIKNHVGLRRPLEKGTVHGMAQIEWHLHFKKR